MRERLKRRVNSCVDVEWVDEGEPSEGFWVDVLHDFLVGGGEGQGGITKHGIEVLSVSGIALGKARRGGGHPGYLEYSVCLEEHCPKKNSEGEKTYLCRKAAVEKSLSKGILNETY